MQRNDRLYFCIFLFLYFLARVRLEASTGLVYPAPPTALRALTHKHRIKTEVSSFFVVVVVLFLFSGDVWGSMKDYLWQTDCSSVVYHILIMHGRGRLQQQHQRGIFILTITRQKTTPLQKCLLFPLRPLMHTDRFFVFALTFTCLQWLPETDWKRRGKAWLRRETHHQRNKQRE